MCKVVKASEVDLQFKADQSPLKWLNDLDNLGPAAVWKREWERGGIERESERETKRERGNRETESEREREREREGIDR